MIWRSPLRRGRPLDQKGTSTVEMALLAPFFAMLVLGTVDAARAASEKIALQQAASRAIEMVTSGSSDMTAVKTEAAATAGVGASAVTVDRWMECDRVRQNQFDGSCSGSAEIGRYVSVAVTK